MANNMARNGCIYGILLLSVAGCAAPKQTMPSYTIQLGEDATKQSSASWLASAVGGIAAIDQPSNLQLLLPSSTTLRFSFKARVVFCWLRDNEVHEVNVYLLTDADTFEKAVQEVRNLKQQLPESIHEDFDARIAKWKYDPQEPSKIVSFAFGLDIGKDASFRVEIRPPRTASDKHWLIEYDFSRTLYADRNP